MMNSSSSSKDKKEGPIPVSLPYIPQLKSKEAVAAAAQSEMR